MEVGPSKQGFTFKVDIGSQVNILPYYDFQQLGVKTALNPSHTKLLAKLIMAILCTLRAQLRYNA